MSSNAPLDQHPRLDALLKARSINVPVDKDLKALLQDINAEMHLHDETLLEKENLEKSLLTLQTLLDTTPEAVFSFKAGGAFEQMNSAAARFLKIEHMPMEEVRAEDTLPALLALLKKPDDFLAELEVMAADNHIHLRGYAETIDGRDFEFYSAPKILNGSYVGRIWCWRDITEARKKDAIIEHQAFHDALTGLPNRRLLLESLSHALARAKRNNTLAAVLFIDLDDFKKINDTAGHQHGDEFLIAVSERIKSCVRSSDVFGRSGGDEFLIIAEDLHSSEEIVATYKRILKSLQKAVRVENQSYFVSCSIGASLFPQDGGSAQRLIQRADTAMYEAKRMGKNNCQMFKKEMEEQAQHKLNIENALRDAIFEHKLDIYFQPEVNIASGKTEAFEALVRWPQNDGGYREPSEFITIAEEAGMIYLLTEWVIDRTFSALQRWQGTAAEAVPIAINLSALDFQQKSLTGMIIKAMEKYQITGHRLIFEVQESVFLGRIDLVKNTFETLGKLGIRFAIDDFGTGYSSFKYLQLLSFDFIKIDRSFIVNIDKKPQNAAIAKSIIDISSALNATSIAEGIESAEELQFLEDCGCDIAQGYYLGYPMPESEVLDFLSSQYIKKL